MERIFNVFGSPKTKRIIPIVFFLLMLLPAHAQNFEWVRDYSGIDRSGVTVSSGGSYVVNSFVDSEGNCYILGRMARDATYNGELLAPVSNPTREGTLIAKFSPNGEMVWHKAITSPGQSNRINVPMDMRPMGDSAFVCVVQLDLDGPLYYLDTLLEDVSDCLMPTDSISFNGATAFITFDLDGNVLEQHFLQTGYLDAQGQIMTIGMLENQPQYSDIFNTGFPLKKLQIDNSGNIVSLTDFGTSVIYTTDTGFALATFENGLLSGFCILVDGRSRFKMHVNPHEKHALWTPVVIKFDPHFDSLLAWRHLLENEHGDSQVLLYSFNIDKENSLYICASFQAFSDDVVSFTVAGNPSIGDSVGYDAIDQEFVLLKYDSNLNCQFLKKMEWGERNFVQICGFSDVCFAEDSSFFVTATILNYQHVDANIDNLHFTDSGSYAAIIHFDKDGTALSYGKAHSHNVTTFEPSKDLDQSFVAKNNRVIAQVVYVGDIFANHDSASVDMAKFRGDGLYQWDYDGNPISYTDFNVVNPNKTRTGGVYLHDSILYVTGKLGGGGTFGDIVIPDNGRSRGFVAKYVDTNFMHPYVAPVGIADSPSQRQPLLYPNPARNEVFIDLGPDPIRQVSAINALGQRQSLPFVANCIDLSSCRPGIYILEIKTPSATHKSKLVKMK